MNKEKLWEYLWQGSKGIAYLLVWIFVRLMTVALSVGLGTFIFLESKNELFSILSTLFFYSQSWFTGTIQLSYLLLKLFPEFNNGKKTTDN